MSSPYSLALQCFHGYHPAAHLQLISDHLGAMFRKEAPPILLLDAPPRHGKSSLISWALPTYFLLHCPHANVLHASYSEKVSKRFGRMTRDSYRKLSPEFNSFPLSREVNSAGYWMTQASGGMMCAGRGGAFTSFGSNLLILDDVLRNAKEALSANIREGLREWWGSTVLTRREPGALTIVANTRWHRDDLTGYLLAAAKKDKKFAVGHISLPAIAKEGDIMGRAPGDPLWPERFDRKALDDIQSEIVSNYFWRALYLQDPSNPEGAEFKAEYFDDIICPEDEWPKSFQNCAMGVDPSKGSRKGDYQAIVWLGQSGSKLYVDSDMCRVGISELVERICSMSQNGCDGLLLEANSFQDLLAEPIERAFEDGFSPFPIHPITSLQPKELRIKRLDYWLRKGLLRFRDTESNRILIGQLMDFPYADHDDGPDSLEFAIRIWKHLVFETSPYDGVDDVTETLRA